MTEHDSTKLPKWAQDRLRGLQRKVADLETQLREERGQLIRSEILLDPYISPRYLDGRHIVFHPDVNDQLFVTVKDKGIQVQAPNGRLLVLPDSSNQISLRVEYF